MDQQITVGAVKITQFLLLIMILPILEIMEALETLGEAKAKTTVVGFLMIQ